MLDAREVRPEEIYDALDHDACFAALPGRIASAYGARSVLIHWVQHDGTGMMLAHSGYFRDDQLAEYNRHFAGIDPWVIASREHRAFNRAVDLGTLVPSRAFESSVLYNEYIRAMGDDTALCVGMMLVNGSGSGFIALQRGRTQAAFTPRQVARLDRIRPHLARLLTVRGQLAAAGLQAARQNALLESAGLALFLVRGDGTVLYANGSAQALAEEGSVLLVRNGRLKAAVPRAQATLHGALGGIGSGRASVRDLLLLPDRDGAVRSLFLAPADLPGGTSAVTISVLPSRALRKEASPALREQFGLTAAESDIAMMILDGADVSRICQKRGRSSETVRSQIKAVAAKLGCRRQVEIALTLKALVG